MTTRAEKMKATKERKAAEAKAEAARQYELRNMTDALGLLAPVLGHEQTTNNPINPTYRFNIGDQVRFGSLPVATVVANIQDVAYKVAFKNISRDKFGRKGEEFEDTRWLNWTDLRAVEPVNEVPFTEGTEPFYRKYKQLTVTIDSLINMVHHFGIEMDPWWQRGLVWTPEDEQKLLDSIFQGIDIGKIAVIKEPIIRGKKHFTILDGKQRLNTILKFYESRISYRGIIFANLNNYDRHTFTCHSISLIEMERPADEREILEYFHRLNVSGRPVNPEHLRMIENEIAQRSST